MANPQPPRKPQTLGDMLRDPETWKAVGRRDTWVAVVLLAAVIAAVVGGLYLFDLILSYGIGAAFDAVLSVGGIQAAVVLALLLVVGGAWVRWSEYKKRHGR